MIYNLCQQIVKMRFESGMSQAELARRLDVSRSSVNAWELGFATPQLKHVVEMARIFNTTVDNMLNISEEVSVNITELDDEERQIIFNLVNCFKRKKRVKPIMHLLPLCPRITCLRSNSGNCNIPRSF